MGLLQLSKPALRAKASRLAEEIRRAEQATVLPALVAGTHAVAEWRWRKELAERVRRALGQ